MSASPLAGKPAPASLLVNVPRLVTSYYTQVPDPGEAGQRVAFGTSGHRGISFKSSFNEAHILAITQALCEMRRAEGLDGPLFLGFDTHALSEPAFATAMEVLAAHGVAVRYQTGLGYTPTPAVSHAILTHNRGRTSHLADGIVITPSHNPPEGGGFKYNPAHGGPAGGEITSRIETRANELLAEKNRSVQRIPLKRAMTAEGVLPQDFIAPYVADLAQVLDLEAVRRSGLKLGVDPMGGAALGFWGPVAERYHLDLTIVNERVDPTFGFMPLDHDGRIRMDCSSPDAMAGLIGLKDRFDLAWGNDADTDRHGIVTRAGLMNPNHYLAVAIQYLFGHRPGWSPRAAVGKTLVSSALIDRVTVELGRPLYETPVGFKWFVEGLLAGSLGFGGEESAGASFLRKDGGVWTTDKDGLLLGLLAAEIQAVTGRSPSDHYRALVERLGEPVYERLDAPISPEKKVRLAHLRPEQVKAETLAGEPITARLSHAPGNGAAIGGLKVTTANGWFAARPSGTEDIYKIYAESFRGREHLRQIQEEAKTIVDATLAD